MLVTAAGKIPGTCEFSCVETCSFLKVTTHRDSIKRHVIVDKESPVSALKADAFHLIISGEKPSGQLCFVD